MQAADGTLTWDLWMDFQAVDAGGLTAALVEHARPGVTVEAGQYLVVGSDDSELAVARVESVEPSVLVYAVVLTGPPTEHLRLIGTSGTA
jgi:hypothetical protein